jgi:glycine/D-amino acid oxidase-like deaminating enzyme
MKTIVLGAGIVGVTSAYQLARAGHEVTVIERQPGPALETSFANAGEVSFGYCSPWAAPGIPAKAIKWLLMKHAPLILRPRVDVAMLSWLVKMLSNCTSTRYAINKSRMLRLADYSRTSLAELRKETGIAYDERMQGTLQLFRERAQLDACALVWATASVSAAWRKSLATPMIWARPLPRARILRDRSLSGRRRYSGIVLVRSQTDDAGWHAHYRSHETRRTLPQYRPRHARLDNELRFGSSDRRHCKRP